jgi:hypothetical protein
VGLIPLFAVEVVDQRLLAQVPRFRRVLKRYQAGLCRDRHLCLVPDLSNERQEYLLALVEPARLARILPRLLDEAQFLSLYGIRGVSHYHAEHPEVGWLPGDAQPARVDYSPGESTTPMFGGNSNWRGPVWFPTNYALVQALEKYHRYLGSDFKVTAPCLGEEVDLRQAATLIAERLVDLYRQSPEGVTPAMRRDSPFQHDVQWKDLFLFYEYFHAETGQGLGAAHQTGWTGLIANLVMRRYQKDVTPWSGLDSAETATPIDEMA